VLGAIASKAGTEAAFGAVAGLALVLAAAAAATPAAAPETPQPLRMLVDAVRARKVQAGIWLCVLPSLLFGTLSVLAPLRLSHLGWGAVAVGATFLVSAALEASWTPVLGRISDRRGRFVPLRGALIASALVSFLLPWPTKAWLLAVLVVCAAVSYVSFWTPAMSMITDAADEVGLDYGYAFALVNVAWAPGQAGGSAIGGAVASATTDAVSYISLAGLCLVTLAALARYRETATPLPAER
jgi:predicted MFS family arabinose efflux permease